MKKRKVIALIKLLSKKERTRFKQFLRSPYHNLRDNASVLLFDFLEEVNLEKVTIEMAYHHVYKNSRFNKKKIENKCSNLVLLIERFLIIEQFQKEDFEQLFYLSQAYKNKKKTKLFQEKIIACEKSIESQPTRSVWYHIQKLKLAHQQYFYLNPNHYSQKGNEYFEHLLLMCFSVFSFLTLRYGIEAVSRSRIVGRNFSVPFLKEVKRYTDQNNFRKKPLYSVYVDLIDLLKKEAIDFDQLFKTFKAEMEYEDEEGLEYISTSMINFAGLKLNQGHSEFKKIIYELYLILLDLGALESEGFLASNHFLNIGILSTELGDAIETERFLNKYLKLVKESSRENCRNTIMAYTAFEEKDFDKTILALNSIDYKDLSDKERTKVLLIRTYYELIKLGGTYPLKETCKAFHMFLVRTNDIAEDKKIGYFNFIKEVKKIKMLLQQRDKKAIVNASRIFESINPISCKIWLSEKYKELINLP